MKNKIFLIIFLSFFVFYIVLLFAFEQGYYKNRNEKAKTLTDEQIIEFEKDIKNGKSVDITKYVLYEDKDYTTGISNDIYKLSLKLEKVMDTFIRITFNKASRAIND